MKSTRVSGLGIVLGTIMLTASMCGAAAQTNRKAAQGRFSRPRNG
jgi:hypothetical protein